MAAGACGADGREHGRVGAGHEQRVAARDDPLGDRGDLVSGLAKPEDDFREALARGAVVIDPREAQILERLLAEFSRQLIDGGVEREVATGDDARAARGCRVGSSPWIVTCWDSAGSRKRGQILCFFDFRATRAV